MRFSGEIPVREREGEQEQAERAESRQETPHTGGRRRGPQGDSRLRLDPQAGSTPARGHGRLKTPVPEGQSSLRRDARVLRGSVSGH